MTEYLKKERVEVFLVLTEGFREEGEVWVYPEQRLSVMINECGNFFPFLVKDKTMLVNKNHVISIEEVKQ